MSHRVWSEPLIIEETSIVAADQQAVWQRVSTAGGINAELWPVRMHLPPGLDVLGELVGTKRTRGVLISLLGILPLDWHRLGIDSLEPGHGFREESTSLWMSRWVHVRRLQRLDGGCRISDRVEFTPRLSILRPLLAPIYRQVFQRRHRELRRHFGIVANVRPG